MNIIKITRLEKYDLHPIKCTIISQIRPLIVLVIEKYEFLLIEIIYEIN